MQCENSDESNCDLSADSLSDSDEEYVSECSQPTKNLVCMVFVLKCVFLLLQDIRRIL